MLASCSGFLCAEVDVLIEFPGHNSELAALEVWLFGWHLVKVGMSRYKMVQEDVRIPIGQMHPHRIFVPEVRRKRHLPAPRS